MVSIVLGTPSIRQQIQILTENGKRFLSEASSKKRPSIFADAIQEFVLAYKFSLLLNSDDGTKESCAFNLGAAHIAGGDSLRGIDIFFTLLNQKTNDNAGLTKKKLEFMRGDIYFNLALGYEKMNDSENAFKNYNKSLAEYNERSDADINKSEILIKLGNACEKKLDLSQAQRFYSIAAQLNRKVGDFDKSAMALLSQANAASADSSVSGDACLQVLEDCCKECHKLSNTNLQGKILCEVGLLYSVLGQKKHALACFDASIRYYGDQTEHKRKAIALQNAGAILNTMGRYEEAEMYHEEACQSHGVLGNRNAQGQCFCNLAYVQSQLFKYDDAEEAYLHALQAFKDTNDKHGQWQAHEGLGAISFIKKNLNKAELHFEMALAINDNVEKDDSRERIVTQLSNLLQYKNNVYEKPMLAIEDSEAVEKAYVLPVESGNDAVIDGNKPARHSAHNVKKRLDRGRRHYSDEDLRPVKHVARGLSIMSKESVLGLRKAAMDEARKKDARFNIFGFIESPEDSYESSSDSERLKNQEALEATAQVSLAPISVVSTEGRSDSLTGILRKSRRTKPRAKKHISMLESDGDLTARSDKSSGRENIAKQLNQAHDVSDDSSFTNVSSSENEDDISLQTSGQKQKPQKPPRKVINQKQPSTDLPYCENEPVYAQSLKITKQDPQSTDEKLETDHLYESIKLKTENPNQNEGPSRQADNQQNFSISEAKPEEIEIQNSGQITTENEDPSILLSSFSRPGRPTEEDINLLPEEIDDPIIVKASKNKSSKSCIIM